MAVAEQSQAAAPTPAPAAAPASALTPVAATAPTSAPTSSPAPDYAPGMRVIVRGMEWLVQKVETNSLGNPTLYCRGVSPLVRDREAAFLADVETSPNAGGTGGIELVDPAKTRLVDDASPNYRDARLYIESQLRRRVPCDDKIHVGHKAAMDTLSYQLKPASEALKKPRQRILIADSVGLGKTLEAGILMSELIARGKGRRILVVTSKSMLTQFQMEMWERFTIPLVRLDSQRLQRIRQEIPSNANPFFYYDRAIVSVDTIKRNIEYGVHLENAYWDIIVIDEAQNVAERGKSRGANSQRSKLAEKLASRSDTLVMLSATPHDGSARSFASLMTMLDPTAIADPDHYAPEDIKGLFVRRFKKDVRDQGAVFQERDVAMRPCDASPAEERAFDAFAELRLYSDEGKGPDQLFKITLEKALFSSPAACVQSIDERVRHARARLESLPASAGPDARGGLSADIDQLLNLRRALEAVGPWEFSRYQGLLALLRDRSYAWDPKDPADRVVVFTERIATMEWVASHLKADLGMGDAQVLTMHGGMSDVEQQDVVERFKRADDAVRVLVASDVASEGINLHYLCHRLVHFDTPWSLMVFQQRNGRVDRYGQEHRPLIRFMTVNAKNDRIRGDARILQVLIEKERQANENIGDPAVLMNKYDVDAETLMVTEAIASGEGAEAFGNRLSGGGPRGDQAGGGQAAQADPFAGMCELELLLQSIKQGSVEQPVVPVTDPSLFNAGISDKDYLQAGLDRFGAEAGVKYDKLADAPGLRLTFDRSGELYGRLRRAMPQAELGDRIDLCCDRKRCMDEVRRAREADFELGEWPQTQYLWRLHPVLSWLDDKAQTLIFARDEAPLMCVRSLQPGQTWFLVAGTIPNRKSAPVVDACFGLAYRGGRFERVVGDVGDFIDETGIGDSGLVNRRDTPAGAVQAAQALMPDAVAHAREHMAGLFDRYRRDIEPRILAERKKLNELREKHVSHARQESLPGMGEAPAGVSRRRADERVRKIERTFSDYETWVTDTLRIQNNPNIKILAVIMGAAR